MGITKTDGFSQRIIKTADQLKAIGHPARLAILEYLAKKPGCICNDIVDELPLAQPTISRHLSELKKVGLIKGTIEGKNICYCVDPKTLNKLYQSFTALANKFRDSTNCC